MSSSAASRKIGYGTVSNVRMYCSKVSVGGGDWFKHTAM